MHELIVENIQVFNVFPESALKPYVEWQKLVALTSIMSTPLYPI